MAQLTLFDSSERLLADDERGRITYTPGFVEAGIAEAWFEELRAAVNWRAERRVMYEREVDVPRLIGHFRLDEARRLAARRDPRRGDARRPALGVPFNSVGLNLYRDGRDSVAPHNDHLNEIQKGFPIALVSLGATRRMTIRAKAPPRTAVHIDLEPGSFVRHGLRDAAALHPRRAEDPDPVGERISLAFRVKQRRVEPDDAAGGFYR